MTEIGSATSKQRFNDDELDAMRHDTTSTTVNKARRDAGFKEGDVGVRGDDKTLDQVLEARHTHVGVGETLGSGLHVYEVVEVLHGAQEAATAAGRLAQAIVPIVVFGATQYSMYEMEKDKAAMKDGATRDQLHAAILMHLDVPTGFKQEAIAKLNVDLTNHGAANRIGNQIDGSKYAAALQLHCDEGMNAARTMIESGSSEDAFLAANPKIAERYAADAAFHNGFDALAWAKADSTKKGGDPKSYSDAVAALNTRDARYDAAHITYRM